MITIAWYLLKVIICSGVLFSYYYAALRDKIFHRWNRFYLLGAVVISMLVPLIQINIFQNADANKGTVIKVLQTISASDEMVMGYSRNNVLQLGSETIGGLIYLLITLSVLFVFIYSLYKISRLRKTNPETKLEGINFISTDAKGTPFSFFDSIFWNNAIDIYSKHGHQIFNHEIAHVKEKHSYDKLFMNVVLIFFWINPFFWLMQKELSMIHEFIADKEALEDSDISAFAEMILQTVYPGQQFITNNFFHSPLKRRLIMFTKNKNPKVNYVSRLMVLPLAAFVFFAFTLKMKTIKSSNAYNGKKITVIIDAGHGGSDDGAIAKDGLKEKDINLSIAKKVAELNTNDRINILLLRSDDKFISPQERVAFAESKHPDLYISLHVNATDNNDKENGFSVLIDKNNSDKNKLLASAIINQLKKIYTTESTIGVRTQGVWILDHNICPASIIECGYITNEADEAFISNNDNQGKIAKNILAAINDYSENSFTESDKPSSELIINSTDTTPELFYKKRKLKNISVTNDAPKVKLTYEDGTKETITEAEAKGNGLLPAPPPPPPLPAIEPPAPHVPTGTPDLPAPPPPPPLPANALYIIDDKVSTEADAKALDKNDIKTVHVYTDNKAILKYGDKAKNGAVEINTNAGKKPLIILYGKEVAYSELDKISPEKIESINVLKGEEAKQKYGYKGNNGVIEMILKKDITAENILPDKVFTQLEQPASFPGGSAAWVKYITQIIQKNLTDLSSDKTNTGTCIVKFIVNTDGSITNIEATTMKGTKLSEVAINALKESPKWIPGKQNEHIVASYVMQPVSFKFIDQKN